MGNSGHPEDILSERPGERERLEDDHLGAELAADTQNVVDHVVDHDFAERPWKEVVEDAFGRNAVSRGAASPRRKTGHHVGLAAPCLFKSRSGLFDDRSRFRSGHHEYVVASIEQGADLIADEVHGVVQVVPTTFGRAPLAQNRDRGR